MLAAFPTAARIFAKAPSGFWRRSRAGVVKLDVGGKLCATFLAAGLPPQMINAAAKAPPAYSSTVITPTSREAFFLRMTRVAKAAEVEIDSFA